MTTLKELEKISDKSYAKLNELHSEFKLREKARKLAKALYDIAIWDLAHTENLYLDALNSFKETSRNIDNFKNNYTKDYTNVKSTKI
jgi:hypothetical protein